MSTSLGATDYPSLAATWIDHVLTFTTDFSEQYGNLPEPDSAADQEMNHSGEVGRLGPWTHKDCSRPYEIAAGLMLIAVTHQLASLEQLFGPQMALFGFQSIVRSIIEACSYASWVLEPAIGIRERYVRSGLLELDSVREAKKVELAAGKDGAIFNAQISELKVRLALLNIDETLDRHGALIGIDGRSLPGKLDAVTRFMPRVGVEHGEMWYRTMSGVAHSVLYGIMEYLQAGTVGSDGFTSPVPTLPLQTIANAAVVAIDGYLQVVEQHAELWGRDSSAIAATRLMTKGALLSALGRPSTQWESPPA